MAHGHEALERGQACFVEHLGHKAEVFRHHDRRTVAHGDAGALLTAMLQRLQAEARHARHVFAGSEHAEHGALLFEAVGALARQDGRAHEAISCSAESMAATASGSMTSPSPSPTVLLAFTYEYST